VVKLWTNTGGNNMGSIISSRRNDDKIVVEVSVDYKEFLDLQGHFDNVHLFTEEVAVAKTNISQRGKNEATKYFLIPRTMRKGFKFNNSTYCQRMDIPDKTVFIYVVDKLNITPRRKDLQATQKK
jgi:hypothetical protein